MGTMRPIYQGDDASADLSSAPTPSGRAILIVTVLVKLLFFPLANKSYASMAKMMAVQPETDGNLTSHRKRVPRAYVFFPAAPAMRCATRLWTFGSKNGWSRSCARAAAGS